jgi:hypothetical protein
MMDRYLRLTRNLKFIGGRRAPLKGVGISKQEQYEKVLCLGLPRTASDAARVRPRRRLRICGGVRLVIRLPFRLVVLLVNAATGEVRKGFTESRRKEERASASKEYLNNNKG